MRGLGELDTLRSTGLRYAWRRIRDDAAYRRRRTSRRDAFHLDLWRQAAEELGAEFIELSPRFGEIRRGEDYTRIWGERVAIDDIVSLELAGDKVVSNELLSAAGLPVPPHLEFNRSDLRAAKAFLERQEAPCVVKPASGTGKGNGVTTGVTSAGELVRAAARAARYGSRLMIERQARGDVYRLLLLDGELLDALRRLPPRVVGDGVSTIRQLVIEENHRRLDARGKVGFTNLKLDLDAVLTLRRANLTVRSVPPRGSVVQVKTVTNQGRVEDIETVHDPISEELVEEAARGAEVLGLRLAGVDIVTSDLGSSLAASGGVITEVNGTPGIHFHYNVAEPERATPVAIPILSKLLNERVPAPANAR